MSGPLDGYRVMDMTLAAAGPWTCMLLGALGAEVIKVEPPGGEIGTAIPPSQQGLSAKYIHCNLNKKMIVLDLKDEQDKRVAHDLAAVSDVFVENMRPGTVGRLGFDYDQLSALNERLVYCSMSAFGQRGPMAQEAGADPQVQAFCGWSSVTGYPGGRPQLFRHFAHIDLNTASYAVSAILMALYARRRTGKGQKIEMSMTEAAVALQTTRLAEYFGSGKPPAPLGSASATTTPHEAFRCQDGEYLAIGVEHERQWAGLRAALKIPPQARFADNAARLEHRAELSELLAGIFVRKPAMWWTILLRRHGVPAAPVLRNSSSFGAIQHDPQNTANGHLADVPTHWGTLAAGGLPWRFSRTPVSYTTAPRLGEHSDEVRATLAATAPKPAPVPA
jgi:crotonobetainyl-CoA:carnitine CoA-transferase CaiB-like acyl-CoA transferase